MERRDQPGDLQAANPSSEAPASWCGTFWVWWLAATRPDRILESYPELSRDDVVVALDMPHGWWTK